MHFYTFSIENLHQIWSSAPSDTQYLAVVIEKEPYSNGFAVSFLLQEDQDSIG